MYSVLIVVVVVLVMMHIVVELVLLRARVLHVAVELSCSRRPPSWVGGGSAQAAPPREGRCGVVVWPVYSVLVVVVVVLVVVLIVVALALLCIGVLRIAVSLAFVVALVVLLLCGSCSPGCRVSRGADVLSQLRSRLLP